MEYIKVEDGNFTKIKFENENEYKEYLKENKNLFQFVSSSNKKHDDGTITLVF